MERAEKSIQSSSIEIMKGGASTDVNDPNFQQAFQENFQARFFVNLSGLIREKRLKTTTENDSCILSALPPNARSTIRDDWTHLFYI